eukprot:scaffold22589_cov138-Cylindrotheca_fusiformis.AAC.46
MFALIGHQQKLATKAWRPSRTSLFRCFASASPQQDDKTTQSSFAGMKEAEKLVDHSARGIGQVIFLNSPVSGAVILGGLAVSNPYLASLAALGTITATGSAKAAGLDDQALKDGLLTYNGCLIGCAAAVFGPSSLLACTSSTIIGAAATPFVAATLKETMTIPQWTYSFNLVALTSLLRTRPLLPTDQAVITDVPFASSVGFGDLIMSPFTGISQIFVVDSALSGFIIFYGIGMVSTIRQAILFVLGIVAKGHALMGSTLGTLCGAFMGADVSELAMGLWGYNSALTSMAIGVFFVHSTPTLALSAGGAAATAAVFGAMKSVFGAYGAPALTLPFCTAASACYYLGKQIPALQYAKAPHSPEKNSA